MADTRNSDLQHGAGSLRRIWLRLNSPSVTWSVLTLLIVGIVTGVGCVIVPGGHDAKRKRRILRQCLPFDAANYAGVCKGRALRQPHGHAGGVS